MVQFFRELEEENVFFAPYLEKLVNTGPKKGSMKKVWDRWGSDTVIDYMIFPGQSYAVQAR